MKPLLPIGIVAILLLAAGPAWAEGDSPEQLFVRRIQPLFSEKCLACHGNDPAKLKSGFDMRSRAAILAGGESGLPGLVPGKPEASAIFLAVTRRHDDWEPMPPKEADQLSTEQVAWVKEWIAQDAPWPEGNRAREIAQSAAAKWSVEDGVTVKTSGGLAPEWTNRKYRPEGLWAYQPVRKPALAQTGAAAIDALIAKRIPDGLAPAPPADVRTLIRRATFDLTGLPPSPEEVAAFERDSVRDPEAALRGLIDRLLASPHYGERMAQHWLDVVRYADSSGFANDYERGNAWRYRDYVVRAFNQDKPYDQFIREQIAGDELAPADPEQLIATGFLRMGPWELTAMEVPKVARQRFLDDVTNSVGETFLAHSLQCARCHDHKFDPVPTGDYYSLQAVFGCTQLAERPAPFLPAENTHGFEERGYLEKARAAYRETLQELDEVMLANAMRWFAANGKDSAQWQAAVESARRDLAARQSTQGGRGQGRRLRDFSEIFSAARETLLRKGVPETEFPPKLVGFTPAQFGMERVARKGLERLTWELDRYEPYALAVYNGRTPVVKAVAAPLRIPANRLTEGELEQTCVLAGGDPFSPRLPVKPGVLSVLGDLGTKPLPDSIEGRRKAFAEWVASPANPLTPRVIVNRVWMWHFGEAIAGNPNNFGSTGKRPTHPELLDWLAGTFVEQRWSFKALHRVIMSSAAYRRSSLHPERKLLAANDPAGISGAVFKPRRLSAEELRDAMLAATGELNPELGGIPNRPEINLEAALQPRQVMGTFAAAWTPNPLPNQRHRRSLYALKLRGLRDPALEVFNSPAPDFSCERRESSTITPQVFALFNSQASQSRALALAARALKETAGSEAALTRVFGLLFGRGPKPDEMAACLAHWQQMEGFQSGLSLPGAKQPLEVRREAVEENTGEKFSFTESLYASADFVSDLQPSACDARTRALADVCLVLLNSNEFAYVD